MSSPPMKRGRGRPPKAAHHDVPPSGNPNEATAGAPSSAAAVPKKRGRPSKITASTGEQEQSAAVVPKKRGRPPKILSPSTEEQEQSAAEQEQSAAEHAHSAEHAHKKQKTDANSGTTSGAASSSSGALFPPEMKTSGTTGAAASSAPSPAPGPPKPSPKAKAASAPKTGKPTSKKAPAASPAAPLNPAATRVATIGLFLDVTEEERPHIIEAATCAAVEDGAQAVLCGGRAGGARLLGLPQADKIAQSLLKRGLGHIPVVLDDEDGEERKAFRYPEDWEDEAVREQVGGCGRGLYTSILKKFSLPSVPSRLPRAVLIPLGQTARDRRQTRDTDS